MVSAVSPMRWAGNPQLGYYTKDQTSGWAMMIGPTVVTLLVVWLVRNCGRVHQQSAAVCVPPRRRQSSKK